MKVQRGYELPQRGLTSQQDSATIENAHVPRSRFLNRWNRKTAFDAGKLIPILVDEMLPGDHISYDVTAYVRMATPLFPQFDGLRVDTHFFFVPNRLVWNNWVKFMGEQDNPNDGISYTIPQVTMAVGGEAVGSIYDHFGLPVQGQITPGQTFTVNVLPLRCYNLIYNTWFRDENIQNSVAANKGDGPDAASDYTLLNRAKSHDYFTSALPWPQKFTAPSVPLGGLAPVQGIGFLGGGTPSAGSFAVTETARGSATYANIVSTASSKQFAMESTGLGPTYVPMIYADLAQATGVAINTLRQAWMVQQLLERDARGGTRYVELIRSHFGVINPDFRLQRPEYIGGGQSPLNITPIAQTAPTTGVPLGALGGAGTAAGTHRATYAATEHGYVIGLLSIKSELSYQQGAHRLWNRLTRYDFYWPSLAGLGEQAILNREIYAQGNGSIADTQVFGYQERWQEYRTRYSEVTGLMRSTATGTLDAWHLSQKFSTLPTLNTNFIQEAPPMARILAAGTQANGQQFLADIMYNRIAVRPIPTYGTPVALGRF